MAPSYGTDNACNAYFTVIPDKIHKMHKISLRGVILILKYHNPLRRIDAWEIAKILNQDNELRMRARISRLRSS